MNIRLNDKPHVLAGAATVLQLLQQLGQAERRGVGVAVNDAVVLRSAWAAHALNEGDRVLIIQATQGG